MYAGPMLQVEFLDVACPIRNAPLKYFGSRSCLSLCPAGCDRWLLLIYLSLDSVGYGWWLVLICCEKKILLVN